MYTKQCTVCKLIKPLNDFYNMKASGDGKTARCKSCDKAAGVKYRKENPGKLKDTRRRVNLKQRFGLTLEDYDKLLRKQNGKCGICGTESPKVIGNNKRSFCVDHDHDTGKIRGLLCSPCNRGLGLLGDTLDAIDNVSLYLYKALR